MLLIFLSIVCYSQDPQYEIYGVKDGLPSPEVYHAVVDQDGQIVLTTDRGVAIYNGYKFINYSYSDGLLDNSNFRIIKHKNELWFLGFNGKITRLKDGVFSAHPLNQFSDTLQNFTWWEDIVFINDTDYYLIENLTAGLNSRCFEVIDENGKLSVKKANPDLKAFKSYAKDRYAMFGCEVNDRFMVMNRYSKGRRGEWRNEPIDRFFEPGERAFGNEYVFFSRVNFDRSLYDTSYYFTLTEPQLFFIKDGEIESFEQFNSRIVAIFPDENKSLWVCTEQGIFNYWKEEGELRKNHYFKEKSISSIVQDFEGNYWVTTLSEGIFKVPSFSIKTINSAANNEFFDRVISFLVYKDELFYGCIAGEIFRQKNIDEQPELIGVADTRRIKEIFYFHGIRNSDWDIIDISSEKPKYIDVNCSNGYKHFKNIGEDTIVASATRKIFFNILKNGNCEEVKRISVPNDISILYYNDSGSLIIGTLQGLYEFNISKDTIIRKPYFSSQFKDKRISDIIGLGEGNYIVSTMGYGLTFICNNTYTTINTKSQLSSDLINTLFLQNDSTLWVGTNKGLNKIKFTIASDSVLVNSMDYYSSLDGLESNYIIKLIEWKNNLFVASNNGVSHFDISYVPQRDFRAPVKIDSLVVNQQWRLMDFENKLKYNENDITINYSAVQFKKPNGVDFYSYRLLTENEDDISWRTTNNRNITFPNLEPANYTFEIFTNGFGGRKGPVKSISYSITPHFSQTLWFKLLLGCLAIFTIFRFMRSRENRIRQKNELQRLESEYLLKVNDAQLTALRSQMNPHFIFNALNSIQNFVFKKDVRQANHFLTKFSRLIRKSLELSKLDAVPVEDEIEFLNNYLELEKMRFPGLFEYEFHVDPEMNIKDVEIPPLLIQPLLENSIRHGFKGINYLGKLDIYLRIKKEGLNIEIIDNGIGIQESEKSASIKKHKSFAMKILKDRVQMINQVNGNEDSFFRIKEIVDHQGKINGVKANLFIAAIRTE